MPILARLAVRAFPEPTKSAGMSLTRRRGVGSRSLFCLYGFNEEFAHDLGVYADD